MSTVNQLGKYQPYPDYKYSGVEWLGDIPKHWNSFPCRSGVNHLVKKNTNGDEDNYLSLMANIGIVLYEDKGDVGNKKPDDLTKCKIVRKGNLVINSMNYAIGSYGMSPYDGVCSPVYIILDSKPNMLEQRYALRLFENKPFQKQLAILGNGILEHRAAISWDDIKGQYIPLPSLEEQRTIAAFLDYETARIDQLIAKQKQLIELLKEKRQAVISHAVTKGLNSNAPMKESGVEWLGQVPEHWVVKKLKHVAKIIDCKNRTPEYVDDGDYLVVRTTNVKNQSLVLDGALYTNNQNFKIWTERGVPPIGSILFTREAPAGEVCLVPENTKLCMGQRMMNFISLDSEYTSFLFDYLTSDCLGRYISSEASGSTVSHLRVEQVYNIPVVVPPINEQAEIDILVGNIKKSFSALIDKSFSTILLLQERRTALISAAVTGKIDLRGWQPPKREVTA